MTKLLVLIFLLILILDLKFRPYFDYTKKGNLLLWYFTDNETKREYIKIF